MADNSNARFRPSDPFGRGSGPSGPANDPLAERAIKAGAVGLLKKPFEIAKLLDFLA